MNDYFEMEKQTIEIAEAQWDAEHPESAGTRGDRNAKSCFVRQQHREWFFRTDLYSSISVRRDRTIEIRDSFFGSSITVYPPQREHNYDSGEKKVSILPAYINASSWQTGRGDVREVKRHTAHYLRMMDMAIDLQNELNQVIVEWETMDNPFHDAEYYKREAKSAWERERTRKAEEDERKAARQAKKLPTANSSSQTR